MPTSIPINLAVEDSLSAVTLSTIVRSFGDRYCLGTVYSRGGYGYLRKMAPAFNNAAKGMPYLLLTDLDKSDCPASLIESWLTIPRHHNFLFRVAVREIEAWALSDAETLAKFLNVKTIDLPSDTGEIPDPKAFLLATVAKSSRKEIRSDILPRRNSTSKIGPNYNGRLSTYLQTTWRLSIACTKSSSLRRTVEALKRFEPVWPST